MKPTTPRRWTPEEKDLLIELFPDTPLPEMAARLNRPPASVTGKACGMGLQRSPAYKEVLKAEQAARVTVSNGLKSRHWTEEEKAFILANPTLSRTDLMAHFGTTQGHVYRIVSAFRKQGLLPPAVPPKPKPQKVRPATIKQVRPTTFKAQERKVTQAVRRTPAPVKHVVVKEPYNRDAGKVLVKVGHKTWRYMEPDAAAQFNYSQV